MWGTCESQRSMSKELILLGTEHLMKLGLTNWLGWLGKEPWDPHVSTFSTGATYIHYSAWFFMWLLGFELRSSHLHSRTLPPLSHLLSPYKMAWVLPIAPGGCPFVSSPSSSAQREAGHMTRTPNCILTCWGPPLKNTRSLVTRIEYAEEHCHLHVLDKVLPRQNENKPHFCLPELQTNTKRQWPQVNITWDVPHLRAASLLSLVLQSLLEGSLSTIRLKLMSQLPHWAPND